VERGWGDRGSGGKVGGEAPLMSMGASVGDGFGR
jgi:H+/Cl- antiporter ClcA